MLGYSWLHSFKAALAWWWGVKFLGIECEACLVRVPSLSSGRGPVATLTRVETAGGDKQTDSFRVQRQMGRQLVRGCRGMREKGGPRVSIWVGGEEFGIQDEERRRWLLGTWWMT